VLGGHITNDAFLTSYNYLLHQGIIHAPPPEPIIVTPPPEQKNIYWIIKPDDRFGNQIEVNASGKTQLEGQGWVFSLTEPLHRHQNQHQNQYQNRLKSYRLYLQNQTAQLLITWSHSK